MHFRDSREPPEGFEPAGGLCPSACAEQGGSWEAQEQAAGAEVSPQLLLPQVPSWAMDMNVLMSTQMLMEQVAAEGSGSLLYLLYQHLLFNFHLWTLSDFAVRLGRYGDLGEGTLPGRVVVEVLGDLRGHICPGASGGNMTLPWEGLAGAWPCPGGSEGVQFSLVA